jgi:hypothetical protein
MASTIFKRNEIIILLGAGASVEAGIPDSNKMVHEIERLVSNDSDEWSCFRDLYRYIRSAIFYADGLDGIFGDNVPFNIERLVNVLDELHKKERHALYPFVGAWNPKLLDVAGNEFENVLKFRSAIIRILRNEWVALPEKERASYYTGLLRFQKEYEHPLRVFSLNYDLCVENTCDREKVQMGFDERTWDWRLFDETPDDPAPLILYKLHGSVDWYFDKDDRVTYSDSPSTIKDEEIALIFGTSYKLQYVDPFLFLAYELRRWTLDAARVIICIGYGFNDDHINGILQQSLRQDRERKLLAVIGPNNESSTIDKKKRISELLKAEGSQVEAQACGAKEFLDHRLTIASLSKLFPFEEDLFPESPNSSEVRRMDLISKMNL